MPTCCPSPVCVHSWVSTPTRPAVRGPGVQPAGVRPVQCPVIWLPRPDVAVRPAGGCPSARSQPSRPASAGWWRWGRPRYGGQRSRLDRVEFHVVRPRPRRLGRRPEEHGCGHRCGVVCRPAGERRPRTWAGWCFGGRLHPSDRAGQTAARGACRWRLRSGGGVAGAMLPHGTVRGGHLGLEPRLLCVVIAEPDVRMDGPGRTQRARRRGRRAAPARPSQVASATGSTLATP
jgi:hypothetical protein